MNINSNKCTVVYDDIHRKKYDQIDDKLPFMRLKFVETHKDTPT